MSMRASWSTLKRHKDRQSVHCHTSQGVAAVHCHMSQGGPVSLQYLDKYFVVKKEQWVSNACNHNWQEQTQAIPTDVCVTVQTSYRNGRGRHAVKVQTDQQLHFREKTYIKINEVCHEWTYPIRCQCPWKPVARCLYYHPSRHFSVTVTSMYGQNWNVTFCHNCLKAKLHLTHI